ncbi:MAG: RNA-binding protein [Bacteroidota bacterium]
MEIYIYNLDRSTDEDELRELFEEFGDVDSCVKRKHPDPEKDSFSAIISMPYKTEAEEAIQELHGETIDGRDIRVLALPDSVIEEARGDEDEDAEGQEWVFE